MKKSDLKLIEADYELFNSILFNNCLPRATEIDFILHNLSFAAGYSRYREKPSKSGNVHEIAFCKYNKFSQRQIREILIHEMIHLWQVSHVAEWRYKKCSNEVAHDKVFRSKMNVINILLERNGFDLTIKQVCDDTLELDEDIKPKKEFYVIYCEARNNSHIFFKVKEKDFSNIIKKLENEDEHFRKIFKNIYAIKTKSYEYNLLDFKKDLPDFANEAKDINTREDLYNDSDPGNIWIVKNDEFIYQA
jgi:hypothetical protein